MYMHHMYFIFVHIQHAYVWCDELLSTAGIVRVVRFYCVWIMCIVLKMDICGESRLTPCFMQHSSSVLDWDMCSC